MTVPGPPPPGSAPQQHGSHEARSRRLALGGNRLAAITLLITLAALIASVAIGLVRGRSPSIATDDSAPRLDANDPDSIVASVLWDLEHDVIWATPPAVFPSAHDTLVANIGRIPALDPAGTFESSAPPPHPEIISIPDLIDRAFLYDGSLIATAGHLESANITAPVTGGVALWSLQISSTQQFGLIYAYIADTPSAFSPIDCPDLIDLIGFPVLTGNFRLTDGGAAPGVFVIGITTICFPNDETPDTSVP